MEYSGFVYLDVFVEIGEGERVIASDGDAWSERGVEMRMEKHLRGRSWINSIVVVG